MASNYRPNPGNNKYLIRKDARPDIIQWNCFKFDPDDEHLETYHVIETLNKGTIEYTCTCPAYKALCKHIHWVKYLRQKIKHDPHITGGRFFPKEGTWTYERNTE